MKNLKEMLKNKVIILLISIIALTIIVDMIVNGFINTIIANDFSRAVINNPTDLFVKELENVAPTYLAAGLISTYKPVISITVEKSSLLFILYTLLLVVGGIQLVLSGTMIYYSARKTKTRKFLVLFSGILIVIMSLYGIVAGVLKFSEGMTHTFEYIVGETKGGLLANNQDIDWINRFRGQWNDSVTGAQFHSAYETKLAELATSGATELEAEIARLIKIYDHMSPEDIKVVAINNLFSEQALNYVLENNINLQVPFAMNVNTIVVYLQENIKMTTTEQISDWISNPEYQNFLKWIFAGAGVVGMITMTVAGFTFGNQAWMSTRKNEFFKK